MKMYRLLGTVVCVLVFAASASSALAFFVPQRASGVWTGADTGYTTYPDLQFYSPTTGPLTSYDATYDYGCEEEGDGDLFCTRRYPALDVNDRYYCGNNSDNPDVIRNGIETSLGSFYLFYNCQFAGDITAPANVVFSAQAISSSQIDVSWIPSPPADGTVRYQVYIWQGPCCPAIQPPPTDFFVLAVVNVSAPASSYSHTSLEAGRWYAYTVTACDAANNCSGWSSAVYEQTLLDSTPPSDPANLRVTGTALGQINLAWDASTDNIGLAPYQVERCANAGCGSFTVIGTATTNSYSDTGLPPGSTYRYRVRAFDTANNPSNYSNIVEGTTPLAADTTDPTVPGAPSATAVSSSQINLTWGASTDPTVAGQTTSGLAGYRIYRNGSATPTATVGPTTATYSDVGLSPSTTYTYRVSAFDNAGNESAQSAQVQATTLTPPTVSLSASPTSLTLSQSTMLTWSSTNATSCNICSSMFCSGFLPPAGTQTITPATAGSFTYTAMCTGPGGSVSSQPVTISVSVPPPPTVSLSASPTSLTLSQSTMLTWSSTNATSCSASGAWSGAQPVSGSQTATPSATATYMLSCTGPGGSASQSVTVSVTVPAAPVVSLSASPTSLTLSQSTMLTWSSANATSCSATWTASTAVSGSEMLTPLVTTTYSISCTGPGGTVSQSTTVTVSDPPPIITNPRPSGLLAASVNSVTLSIDTNESAYCRYDTQAYPVSATNAQATAVFFSMPGSFGAAGMTHSSSPISVSAGNTYWYYIRCQDNPAGNVILSDYQITFSVATPPNASPIAQFTVTETSPLTVSVDASGSRDPDGTIFQYRWSWGDVSLPDTIGPVTTAQVYPNPGTYIITLQVVDNQGAASTAMQTVTVSSAVPPPPPPPPPPTAGICVAACTPPNVGCLGTDVCGPLGYCIAAGSGGPGPVRANGAATSLDGTIVSPPAGSFPSDTASVTMSLTTDVNATCQYSNVAGTACGAPGMFSFSSTGLTSHSVRLTGLGGVPTQSYSCTFSVRCRDAATGDVNTVDYPISFSIGGATLSSGPDPYLCKVNDSFIRSGLPYFFDVCSPRCDTSADCAAPTPTCDAVKKICRS